VRGVVFPELNKVSISQVDKELFTNLKLIQQFCMKIVRKKREQFKEDNTNKDVSNYVLMNILLNGE
jgi:hypothetical protein